MRRSHNGQKIGGFEGRASNQTTVNVVLRQQTGGVGSIHAATVQQ
jgi:hypothetical protein